MNAGGRRKDREVQEFEARFGSTEDKFASWLGLDTTFFFFKYGDGIRLL